MIVALSAFVQDCENSMLVLLRDEHSGLFYAGGTTWVSNTVDALNFQHSTSALVYIRANRKLSLNIIFASRNTEMNLAKPGF